MNADQVIEGVGKAVASATPAQEYCLFWSDYWWWMCMTKSEWSGWAQVVGTVAAIIASACLASSQFRKIELEKRKAAGDLLLQFFYFFKQIDAGIEALGENIKKGDVSAQEVFRLHISIDEVLTVLRSIKIEELSTEWATLCVFVTKNMSILQSITSATERRLSSHFKDVPFYSPRAVLNSSKNEYSDEEENLFQDIIFMHFFAEELGSVEN